jgi:hypothetical protein
MVQLCHSSGFGSSLQPVCYSGSLLPFAFQIVAKHLPIYMSILPLASIKCAVNKSLALIIHDTAWYGVPQTLIVIMSAEKTDNVNSSDILMTLHAIHG